MEKYLTFLLLLSGAAGRGRSRAHALASAPGGYCYPARRPLVRYLTATLRLTPAQAVAVQQVLRTELPRPLVPEQLVQRLSLVLGPEAQERLQALQANVDSYRTLYYLAARH